MTQAEFKIEGKTYRFKEITIRNYYELQNLLLSPDQATEHKIVELFTECPPNVLRKLKYTDWVMIWDETLLQLNSIQGNTEAIRPIISFQGIEYALPKIEDITVGEFADLDMILNTEGNDKKLVDLAAVIYRPIIKKRGNQIEIEPHTSEGFEYRKEIFMDLPLSAIRSANAFFFNSAELSIKNTVTSLLEMPEMSKIPKEDRETLIGLTQQGIGGDFSTQWLEEMLLNLKQQRNSRLEPLSIGLSGKKNKWIKWLLKTSAPKNTPVNS